MEILSPVILEAADDTEIDMMGIGKIVVLAAVYISGTAGLGENQVQCVKTDTTREDAKAHSEKCYEFDQVIFFTLGDDRNAGLWRYNAKV